MMQEKRNQRQFILLAVLVVLTLLVFLWIQPENRLGVDPDIFQVEDLTAVSKVVLANDTTTVELSFDENQWRVNDRYGADGDMIRVLFATLQQARPKRPVTTQQKDSIFRALQATGVRVSLYADNVLKKEFIAGGNPAKTQAFFADPATGEVYVMTIPGYRVYVSGIFELQESGWRDKYVFGFNWRNFETLRAGFPDRPPGNFTVAMEGTRLGIEGLADADTARLNNYLDAVSLLTVDEYIDAPQLADSLQRAEPQIRLQVTIAGNRTYTLELFHAAGKGPVPGLINGEQVALFDRRKVDYLLKPKLFFRKK